MMKNFKDSFRRHKRAWFMSLGSMSVFFLFGTLYLVPLIDGKTVAEIIGDMMDGVEKQTVVGDDPPPENSSDNFWIYSEPEPYEIFNSPTINFSVFWDYFKQFASYSLEGKHPVSGEWIENNDYLTINKTIIDNTCKLTFIFDAPVTTDYRLTLAIDARVKQYVNKSGDHEYTLSYEMFNETFNLVFNWSDMLQYSGLIFNHGITEIDGHDYFWFRVRKNNIPEGTHIELDPSYTVVALSSATAYSSQRKLVRQSNGTLWCTFYESSDVQIAWSENDGIDWDIYEVYGATTSVYPTIAVDSNDVVHLVFSSRKNDVIYYQLEYSNSTDWTTIIQIRDESKNHAFPSLAVDSNDNLHIVYEKGEEGTSNDDQVAYINSLDNGGSWSTEQILTDEADSADDTWLPNIAIDSNDVIYVVFQAEDHYTASGTDDDILHMQSSDYGDTWTNWEDDPIYQDSSYNQRSPCVAIDDDDKLHVVWYGSSQNVNDQTGYSYNDSSGWSNVEWVTWDSSVDYTRLTLSANANDYLHCVMVVGTTYLNYTFNDTSSWSSTSALFSNAWRNPNMIHAQYPVIDGLKTNRPKTGYALIVESANVNLTYYASPDLTWDTSAPPPTNVAPTSSDEAPTNQTDCVSYVAGGITTAALVTDFDGDDMNISWYHNTSGGWFQYGVGNTSVSNDTNISMKNANFTTASTKYWWWMIINDGEGGEANDSYSFTICDNDTVVVTLIDYMPSNLRTNNVGEAWYLYNITTNNTAINFYSIVWAFSVNHTVEGTRNTSYSLEDHLAEDKLRGINRNVNNTIETKFNTTAGDGSIGGFGEWNTHDGNKNITLVNSGTNWSLVNATEVIAEHLFSSISFVDIEELAIEDKDLQTIEISKTNFVKIRFNMTDTGWYDDGHYKNTSMLFHLYANQTNAIKPLDIFYANSNYTTGSISDSLYTELVGDIHQDDSYHFNEYNSSYYEIDFNINETGFVGSVDATSNFSIILCSQTPSVKQWYLHYADDNNSHSLGGNTHYHDFDNRTIMTISDDSATSWTDNSSTPDVYFNYVSLDEEDKSEIKLYANDTSGNEAWSSVLVDLIDITNYAPGPANIIVPNVDTNYTVGDTIPICYHWIGDPNLDTCWVNISLWDWEITSLQTWIVNQSITDTEVMNNNSNFTYNWDTTGITPSNYTIAINITDNSLWNNHSSDIFYINRSWKKIVEWNLTISDTSAFQIIKEWNLTISNVTAEFQTISEWNLTISDSSINQTISEWNLTISNSSSDTQIVEWNLTISNVTAEFQTISEWNLTISDSSINQTISEWNLTISDSSVNQTISEWNLTISNVTAEFQQIQEWNLTITNDTADAWYTISTWNLTISNDTAEFQQIQEWNLTISNTTKALNIQITLENPTNNSQIPYTIPSIYFTLQSLNGSNITYTIYWGETQNNLTTNISYKNPATNGTYYHSFNNASNNETTYYWSVNATDGTIWVNESYSFTTRYERGATGGRLGLLPSIFVIALITYVIVLFILFEKKKKKKSR